MRTFRFLGCLLMLGLAIGSQAHQASESYLTLRPSTDRVEGRWLIAVRDLDLALDLDYDRDGVVSWGDLQQNLNPLQRYVLNGLQLKHAGMPGRLDFGDLRIEQMDDIWMAVFEFHSSREGVVTATKDNSHGTDSNAGWSLRYTLFSDLDDSHRGIVRVVQQDGTSSVVILGGGGKADELVVNEKRTPDSWATLIGHGIHHIASGTDHILFLIALLLPGVVMRRSGRWEGQNSFQASAIGVIKIVTAFTLAHSMTFALSAAGWVKLPGRWVESVIALSVVVAAVNNIRPFLTERGWWMAFGFGLIHGFGFAGALGDLGVSGWELGRSLMGFNIGVELGQLVIVMVFLPVAFAIRNSWFYRRLTLPAGSAAISLIALVWMLERILDVKWLPV